MSVHYPNSVLHVYPCLPWERAADSRVRVDELTVGDRFMCATGHQWTLHRQDAVNPWVFHAKASDPKTQTLPPRVFAGSKQVVLVSRVF